MKKCLVSALCAVVVFSYMVSFVTPANAFEVGARGYYWFPNLKGDIRVDEDNIRGTNLDVENDLGVGNESFPVVEVFAGIGKHHISAMYTQFHYSGTKNIKEPIVFAGQTYPTSSRIESDLKTKMLDIEYQYDLLDLENILAGFSIGVIGKVRYIDGEAELKSPTLGSSYTQKETFQAPIPMVGVGAHIGLIAKLLEARLKATGMGYSGSVFYDVLADISVTPFPFLDIHGGYRYMKLKLDDVGDVYTDLEFAGPYVALTVSF
jgi:outer membrane protein